MVELSMTLVERIAAPPLAPGEQAIDLAHLSRMTLGERSLEQEVLQLFDRQAEMLLGRMRQANLPAVSAFAHTLKGSSRGIGAWRVANAAEAVELAAGAGEAAALAIALDRLTGTIGEARMVIAELLRAH
jgi:HPt (histidine-containing phosphotransfer) domain-containing protein